MTKEEALKLKPANMGLIPQENVTSVSQNELNFFVHCSKTQAWLTSYRMESDYEGPDFYLEYCFETAKGLQFGKKVISYDLIHTYIAGGAAYDHFLRETLKNNRYFTIIYNADNPNEHIMHLDSEYIRGEPYNPT